MKLKFISLIKNIRIHSKRSSLENLLPFSILTDQKESFFPDFFRLENDQFFS